MKFYNPEKEAKEFEQTKRIIKNIEDTDALRQALENSEDFRFAKIARVVNGKITFDKPIDIETQMMLTLKYGGK